MTQLLEPIAPDLWTNEPDPALLGGRLPSGKIVFPYPTGDAAEGVEPIRLSRKGTLWSWTRQDFQPKEPFEGPEPFVPYLIGYVELSGEIIVETLIVDAKLEDLALGMAMEFVVTQFDAARATYAFRPEKS